MANEISKLPAKPPRKEINPKQGSLGLEIDKQALSNPQEVHCYPDTALPEFRQWMREVYLPGKLPTYLQSKVRQGALPASFASLALVAFTADADSSG